MAPLPIWHQYAHDAVAAYAKEEPLQARLRPLLAKIESAKKGASGSPEDVPGLEKEVEGIRAELRKLPKRVGKLEALACKRHLNDLQTGVKRGLWFDEAEASRWIKFYGLFKHTKGAMAGTPFVLSDWQQFIVASLFGWKQANGARRYRYAYIEVARKNGKSTLMAPIGPGMMTIDEEQGAEVYTAATKREQARIVFDEARRMIGSCASARIRGMFTVQAHNIHVLATHGKYEPLGADYNTLDGLNPHCVLVDEYHAHQNDELYNVLKSATGARRQPLMVSITTAGFNKLGPCKKYREYCENVLSGKFEDDSQFSVVFTLDSGDDWADESVWVKANPNIGVSISLEYLRNEARQAQGMPSRQVNFKTKHLNLWTDSSKVWIPDERWMLGQQVLTAQEVADKFEELRGRECFAGLDLASVSDLCSLALLFPPEEEGAAFEELVWNWVPEDGVRERTRTDAVPYEEWVEEGWIEATPGNTTDYNYIKNRIREAWGAFQMHPIEYDRANASQLVIDLMQEGIEMQPFNQQAMSMGMPTREFERIVCEGRLKHFGNPVLRWAMGNVLLFVDSNGNYKPDKKRGKEKVDPIVASIMAFGGWLTDRAIPVEEEPSIISL